MMTISWVVIVVVVVAIVEIAGGWDRGWKEGIRLDVRIMPDERRTVSF